MHIVLLEPFFTGSHKAWAEEFVRASRHLVTILSMEGRLWKWRMHGGAVTLARQFRARNLAPDLLLASDMLDLSTFLGLTRDLTARTPAAVYFHENQMVYPWGQRTQRNNNWRHYAFINYITALSADRVLFSSHYHRQAFLEEVHKLLNCYYDYKELDTVEQIRHESVVLPLGLDLQALDAYKPPTNQPDQSPLILWNHRWETDKNPADFARLLLDLHEAGYTFRVALLGEPPPTSLPAFEELRDKLGERIVQFGYAESYADYARWLWRADILPVTSNQDFFGRSVIEAIYCGCYPILPNRLVYPEHVPQDSEEVLYDHYNELYDKTREAIIHIAGTRTCNFRQWVQMYDWQEMIGTYDEVLRQLTLSD